MRIELSGAGKRFNREWIFRNADILFEAGMPCAITGPNGSGKSTLLQCIGGMLQLSEGSLQFVTDNIAIAPTSTYQNISYCAPYLDVIEEMTFIEFLAFHGRFKPFIPTLNPTDIIEAVGLSSSSAKQIRYYSSGMKQRVKLAQAIFSNTAAVLLDEPCSNLDSAGISLYHALIQQYCGNRILIVCSNDETEYSFCKKQISISDFK